MERPRERLLEQGEDVLSDAELLALFLGSGPAGSSAVDLARHLLSEFGSLRNLLNADRKHLMNVNGVGPARYALLRAALALGRRYQRAHLKASRGLHGTQSTHEFLLAQLRDRTYEVFCCLYLDNRHRLIAFEELFRGTVDSAHVHPREVVRQAIAHNAVAVIFAHNHPSGIAEPSHADELITQRLKESLALVSVRVVDHVIVGDGRCTSFVDPGLL
jgi:DNA repair protein RadC